MNRLIAVLILQCLTVTAVEACEGARHLVHPSRGEVSGHFGYRSNPVLGVVRLHTGVDYDGLRGAPVRASGSGKVVAAGREGGYGNYIRIDHGNGLQTAYAHLQKIRVKPGRCVSKGQVIGTIGSSGIASGVHLHFEVIQHERFANPERMLPDRG